MTGRRILKEHKKLLGLIAKGMAPKSRGDGYSRENWVRFTHGNIVKEMKTNGWPPLINLAKELAEHGLIEFEESSQQRTATVTPEGQSYQSNGTINTRPQAAPLLTISKLHFEVQRIAGNLVADGHYRQAITDTFIGLDNYVETKSG